MNDRTITVKGVGSVSVKPDLIVISMTLATQAREYQETMTLAAAELDSVRAALFAVGYEKDSLKTTDFSINTEYESVKDRQGAWKQQFLGYKCVHMLKLEFDFDTNRLNDTLKAIAASGVGLEFEINFSIKDKAAVSDQLLREAIHNASAKASILADAAHLSLGAIQQIDYNWGELQVISNTRYTEPLCLAAESVKSIDIEPDDIKVNDTVTVVWAIA